MNDPSPPPAAPPWWTFGHVWLVIAGPAIVVVAAFATLWLALAYPESLISEDYYRRGTEQARALVPALQGRNHAATPAGAAH